MPRPLPDLVADGDSGPVAVLAHGAGSSADFVVRAFGAALRAAGRRLVTWDRRAEDGDAWFAEFSAVVEATSPTLVGGVSVGGLLAAHHVLRQCDADLEGLLVVLPPWVGTPDANPGSRPAVETLRVSGVPSVLDAAVRDSLPWIGAELRRSWPLYTADQLADELAVAGSLPAPEVGELEDCALPSGVVALADDPVHPMSVAELWAASLPHAVLATVPMEAAAADVTVFGTAVVRAWQQAVNASR